MAKKINLAERISEMVNDDAARTYIREHTLYPAVLLSGTRIGAEEKVRYRCAHCRHEWEETRSSSHWYHENHIVCPKCHATMFKGTKIPDENEGKPFYHLMLWNGIRVEAAYRIVYVNEAELDGTHGLVIAKYTPEVIYHYSDIPESYDVNLEREAYGFISEKHKIIFNENGTRTTRLIANVFSEYNCMTIASEETNQGSKKFVWMKNGFSLACSVWYRSFDSYWGSKIPVKSKPISEAQAECVLSKYTIPELPEIKPTPDVILAHEVSEDIITGMHHIEYCCKACDARFSMDSAYRSTSPVECPSCGGSYAPLFDTNIAKRHEQVAVISMLDDKTVFIRACSVDSAFDEHFTETYESNELYRAFIELSAGKEPTVEFLAYEHNGERKVWLTKKNYASDKFDFRVKRVEYIGNVDCLKYTGLREYIEEKTNRSPYSNMISLRDIIHYIRYQALYPIVEQLCKRGFSQTLTDEFIHRNQNGTELIMHLERNKVTEVLGLPERLIKHYLKGSDFHSRLKKFMELYGMDPNVREEDIDWLELNGIEAVQVKSILEESQMSIMRLCEYLEHVRINQCFEPKNAIADWRDYLHAAKTIDVDLTDNKARYPSSLKREHDRAITKQKLVLDAKKDEVFQKETEQYGKLYSYKDDDYMIVSPKDMKDLFEEGRKLNHCVGSYSDRIIAGTSCIMFIRKTEDPDKPYFTIEINRENGFVVQLRANSNRLINHRSESDLVNFLKEWSKKKGVALNGAA